MTGICSYLQAPRAKKAKAEEVESPVLDRLKDKEMALLKKQSQRIAKMNVAKDLVAELEGVLDSLPSESVSAPPFCNHFATTLCALVFVYCQKRANCLSL